MIKNRPEIGMPEHTDRAGVSTSSLIGLMCLGGKLGWKAAYSLYRYDIKYNTNFREHPDLYDLFNRYENTFPIKKPEPKWTSEFVARLIEAQPQQGLDNLEILKAKNIKILELYKRYRKTGEFSPQEYEDLVNFYNRKDSQQCPSTEVLKQQK